MWSAMVGAPAPSPAAAADARSPSGSPEPRPGATRPSCRPGAGASPNRSGARTGRYPRRRERPPSRTLDGRATGAADASRGGSATSSWPAFWAASCCATIAADRPPRHGRGAARCWCRSRRCGRRRPTRPHRRRRGLRRRGRRRGRAAPTPADEILALRRGRTALSVEATFGAVIAAQALGAVGVLAAVTRWKGQRSLRRDFGWELRPRDGPTCSGAWRRRSPSGWPSTRS